MSSNKSMNKFFALSQEKKFDTKIMKLKEKKCTKFKFTNLFIIVCFQLICYSNRVVMSNQL